MELLTLEQLPEQFKNVEGYRFSLLYYKGYAAQGISTMAYNYQINDEWSLSNLVLNFDDVILLEDFFKTLGIHGEYKLTKSGTWVRCHNSLTKKQLLELRECLKNKQNKD